MKRKQPSRWLLAGALLLSQMTACKTDSADKPKANLDDEYEWAEPAFDPVMVDSYEMDGATFEIYEVPGLACVRQQSDIEGLPGNAVQPGSVASFVVAVPNGVVDPEAVFYLPPGDSVETLESFAVLTWNNDPSDAFLAMFELQVALGVDWEMTTSEYSRAESEQWATGNTAALALERGWPVVVPGNCWGDTGQGTGDRIIHGTYSAPRYGALLENGVLDNVFERWPESRRLAWGCSNGGARIAARLIEDPTRFDAVVLDAPADNYAAYSDEPATFVVEQLNDVMGAEFVQETIDNYLEAFNGGRTGAEAYSLGLTLGDGIDLDHLPIYLGWTPEDENLGPAVVEPLVDALSDPQRYSNPLSEVHEFPVRDHCAITTDETRRAEAMDWLESAADR